MQIFSWSQRTNIRGKPLQRFRHVPFGRLTHDRFDLLPSSLFKGHVPDEFTSKYHAWYDYHTRDVVLRRPYEDGWPTVKGTLEWRLKRHAGFWRLMRGSQVVVKRASTYALAVSKLFSALEDESHIHVIHDLHSERTSVCLPRLRLDFDIDKTQQQFRSRQHRGYMLDSNQDAGTLVGLTSKIVLCHASSNEDRVMLIPEGPVKYQKHTGGHIQVTVERKKIKKVHAYALDLNLHRLRCTSSMQAKLFLAYLHALTSHCICDPLTNRTGTESALSLLRFAATLSFERLTTSNVEMLDCIVSLAPRRAFWPAGLVGVQKICWDADLPFTSQQNQLLVAVNAIYAQAAKMKIFNSGAGNFEPRKENRDWMRDPEQLQLGRRDDIRASSFRVSGFGAEVFSTKHDTLYEARDRNTESPRGLRAFETATMMIRDAVALAAPIVKLDDKIIGGYLSKKEAVHRANGSLSPATVRYSTKCLEAPEQLLVTSLLDLHQLLSKAPGKMNQYDFITWLSAMAYADGAEMAVIQMLGAFDRCPSLAEVPLPSGSSFYMYLDLEKPRKMQHLKQIGISEKIKLARQSSESRQQFKERKAVFKKTQEEAISRFAAAMHSQWSSDTIEPPAADDLGLYLNLDVAVTNARGLIQKFRSIGPFKKYLAKIASIMSRQHVLPVQSLSYELASPLQARSPIPTTRYITMSKLGNKPDKAILRDLRFRKQIPSMPVLDLPIESVHRWALERKPC